MLKNESESSRRTSFCVGNALSREQWCGWQGLRPDQGKKVNSHKILPLSSLSPEAPSLPSLLPQLPKSPADCRQALSLFTESKAQVGGESFDSGEGKRYQSL